MAESAAILTKRISAGAGAPGINSGCLMGIIVVSFVFDAPVLDWLKAEGVDVPPDYRQSRWPSPNELRTILESLPGYVVRYRGRQGQDWDAEVVDAARGYEGMSATIWVKGVQDPNAPHPFSFHKPWPELAVAILERISRTCGPRVVTNDVYLRPVIVTAGCDPRERAERLDDPSPRRA